MIKCSTGTPLTNVAGSGVGVDVGVKVAVGVCDGVAVAVAMGLGEGVTVEVGVRVGVAEGVGGNGEGVGATRVAGAAEPILLQATERMASTKSGRRMYCRMMTGVMGALNFTMVCSTLLLKRRGT